MNAEMVRSLIREVLAEELGRFKAERQPGGAPKPRVREELVSIASDADLAGFVNRILELARDGQARREVEEGRHVFRLAPRGLAAPPVEVAASPARPLPQVARIESGIVSERQINALPPGTSQLLISGSVRLTPLARDRLKARGITVERTS